MLTKDEAVKMREGEEGRVLPHADKLLDVSIRHIQQYNLLLWPKILGDLILIVEHWR